MVNMIDPSNDPRRIDDILQAILSLYVLRTCRDEIKWDFDNVSVLSRDSGNPRMIQRRTINLIKNSKKIDVLQYIWWVSVTI